MPSPEFFQVAPVADALQQLQARWQPESQAETIATADALDRVLASDIMSPEQVPAFRKSTVDGYALRAADTYGASQSLPAFLTVGGELKMGEAPDQDVAAGEALLIHTGGMLPESADAVVMIEHTQASGAGEIEVLRAAAPGENVIQAGEDVSAGERMLPARQRLRAQDIGALLAVGIASVDVLRPPRIGILSCGDELLPPEAESIPPGQVRDINAYTLSALAQTLGAQAQRLGIAADDFADYQRRAQAGFAACDILLLQRRQLGLRARLHPRCHRLVWGSPASCSTAWPPNRANRPSWPSATISRSSACRAIRSRRCWWRVSCCLGWWLFTTGSHRLRRASSARA